MTQNHQNRKRLPLIILALLYFHFTNTSAQKSCVAGQFRVGTNCEICPRGTFSDTFNVLNCQKCRQGTFTARAGARSRSQCQLCPAGTFAKKEGSRECKKCPTGTDSLPGSRTCASCRPGFSLHRSAGCSPCFSGFFTDKPGSKVCTRCPGGTVSENSNGGLGFTECSKCPPGTFRPNFSRGNECFRCQAGTFSNEPGAQFCKICPPGTYAPVGASTCTPCPKDTFNNVIPAIKCRRCPSGTSTAGPGASACKNPGRGCTFDTFENKYGNCQACLPGERYDPTEKGCIACGSNEISTGRVDTECKSCPAGKAPVGMYSFTERSECECAAGLVQEGEGCTPCKAGSFWSGPSLRVRVHIERLHYVIRGQCRQCPMHTFSKKSGALLCEKCSPYTYQPYRGGTECFPCPRGSGRLDSVDSQHPCIVPDTGCLPGQERNNKGICLARSCPLVNSFLSDKKCTQCFASQMVKNNTCSDCEEDSFRRFPETECKKCSENVLECPSQCGFLGIHGPDGKCVSECPNGTGRKRIFSLRDGALISSCEKCMPREVSNAETGGRCSSLCLPNSIAVDGKECRPCPRGQLAEIDIFGRRVDRCRPRSAYA